ncbi:hypothetical protein JOB18_006763 [Solea senegalensis]|uniref:Uncharacterized protein n=1 Tax=Solea senegalensis TaxID=28829 RepID=A0AAV6QGP3_SOLSE|nr:hypothetical protein JOB18_006763 [Solea senegalensis]
MNLQLQLSRSDLGQRVDVTRAVELDQSVPSTVGRLTLRRSSAALCALRSHTGQQHCLLYLKRHSRANAATVVVKKKKKKKKLLLLLLLLFCAPHGRALAR